MRKIWTISAVVVTLLVAAGCANKYATSGKIALKTRDYDKAIHDFNLAIEADSANAEVHYLLGDVYKVKGDFLSMNKHFQAAGRLSDTYDDEIMAASDSVWGEFFKTGTEKAKAASEEETIRIITESQGETDTAKVRIAWIDKFKGSLGDFQMAIAIQPHRYEAYTNAGYVFQRMGEMDLTYLDSAYAYYQQALNLDRSNVNVLINVANLTYGMGRISEADSMFATVLENEPNNIDALIRRGEIADQQGRYDDAVSYYNRALEQKADLCDVWFNLGVIYFQRLRKMEDAEQAFTRSADLCPDDINAHVNLSVVLITNNRLDEAVSRLSKFTAEHPEECVGWDLYSQALIRNGQKEEALAANKKYEECSQKP